MSWCSLRPSPRLAAPLKQSMKDTILHAVVEDSENAHGSRASEATTELLMDSGKQTAQVREDSAKTKQENRQKKWSGVEEARKRAMRRCLKLRQGASPLRPGPLSLRLEFCWKGGTPVKGSLRRPKERAAPDRVPPFRNRHASQDEGKGAMVSGSAGRPEEWQNSNRRSVLDKHRPSHGRHRENRGKGAMEFVGVTSSRGRGSRGHRVGRLRAALRGLGKSSQRTKI